MGRDQRRWWVAEDLGRGVWELAGVLGVHSRRATPAPGRDVEGRGDPQRDRDARGGGERGKIRGARVRRRAPPRRASGGRGPREAARLWGTPAQERARGQGRGPSPARAPGSPPRAGRGVRKHAGPPATQFHLRAGVRAWVGARGSGALSVLPSAAALLLPRRHLGLASEGKGPGARRGGGGNDARPRPLRLEPRESTGRPRPAPTHAGRRGPERLRSGTGGSSSRAPYG